MSKMPCRDCGHSEDDHDGYGGMCDGLGFNASRTVCGCQEYRAPAADSRDTEAESVLAFARTYSERWLDKDDHYWLARLMEEIGELAAALVNDHDDSPEHELRQIASIAINFLRQRASASVPEGTEDCP